MRLRSIERYDAVDLFILTEAGETTGQGIGSMNYTADVILSLIDAELKSGQMRSAVIERLSDDALIGIISVNAHTYDCVDIAYFMKAELRRQGYMREALQAYCAYVFSRCAVSRIIAQYRTDNEASAALLRSCGFRKTDITQLLMNDYKYHEAITCCLTKDEFKIGGII